ncbi:hypothetical protein ACJIZ3_008774 [Penstemon smallii]|uniref:PIR2-like helical domain-containing protein n=1 Tax=Penstemon smallii TaxID=265156 RepID=A0ABD3TBS7_9LAMI
MEFKNLEEKFRNAVSQLIIIRESEEEEEEEEDESQHAKWEEPFSFELLELLIKNLFEILRDAVKNLTALGYTEEAAEWVVLNTGLLHGSKDVSNVVDGALALLRREKNFDTSYPSIFKEPKNMVKFTLLEMIHVVREISREFDIAETMWSLLVCDLNLLTACKAPPKPKDKEASGGTDNSDSKKTGNPEPENSTCPIHQEPNSNPPLKEESSLAPQETKGKTSTEDEKSGESKKGGIIG